MIGLDAVVRISADCPLLDPVEVDRVVRHFRSRAVDYVSLGYTYPEGFGAEVFTCDSLRHAWENATSQEDREHVTPYIKRTERFSTERLEYREDVSRFRATVDEAEDLQVVEALLKRYYDSSPLFSIEDAISFLKDNPDIATANSRVRRSTGWRA